MTKFLPRAALATFIAPLLVGMALAAGVAPDPAEDSILGVWQRDSGSSRLRIAACGEYLCGTLIWVRDKENPAKAGMRILFNMEPERANNWSGKAFNPEDKETYAGTATVNGDRLVTTGCVIGRLFCKSAQWLRKS